MNVFTYGSLMFDAIWESVCLGQYSKRDAVLTGYARYCVSGESYPALIPETGGQVAGKLYVGVNEEDLQRLNQFEGNEYVLRTIEVDGEPFSFYEFIAIKRLEKLEWDVEYFEKVGLPAFQKKHVASFLATGSRLIP